MCSEKRREANRRNAQRSTGPKTEAGKAQSRRNALKHGLKGAGVVMRRTDEKKLAKRIEDFKEVLAPINPLEENLVERVALAAVRCESAVRQEAAERRRRISKALSRLEAKKRKKISNIAELLACEPGLAGRRLKTHKRGIAWLIAEWRKLAERLEGQGFWNADEACVALRLLGKDPALPYPDDASVHAFRKAFLAALPVIVPEEAECLLGLDPKGLTDEAREAAINASLPEPAEARDTLRIIAADAIARLKQRLGKVRESRREKLERAEAIACAEVGTDITAERLHRYERNQELSLHRNLNELIKIRKQEPELASIARWEKTGKTYNRRWDGYAWVPNSEWRVPEDGEELQTMTDDRWQMTEERPRTQPDPGSGPASVGDPSSANRHCPSSPLSHQSSATSHFGPPPAVWPGLSETCPGLPPNNPGLEEAAGLVAEGPVTATGGSLCSTPGTRSGSDRDEGESGLLANEHVKVSGASAAAAAPATLSGPAEEEQDCGPLVDEHVKVSGASLCSAPGTRSGADERPDSLEPQARTRVAGFSALREPGAAEPKLEPVPGLPADEPTTVAGASPGGLAPATPCGALGDEAEAGLAGDESASVSGSSLCSDPGTRPEGDPKADFKAQAPTWVAGFSALREPGVPESKQEPVPGLPADGPATSAGASAAAAAPATPKAMTDGKWRMTQQTPDPALLSHQSSVISHSPSSHLPGCQASLPNEANAGRANGEAAMASDPGRT